MKYLFVGGEVDGEWREVQTGTLMVNVTTPRGSRQQYAMQGWCPDRRAQAIHRVFVYNLKPEDVFKRLMDNYRPEKSTVTEAHP